MTDQRYTGPDGVKRIELLEELARLVASSIRHTCPHHMSARICGASSTIDRDNGRVDRLKQEREAAAPSDGDDSRWRQ